MNILYVKRRGVAVYVGSLWNPNNDPVRNIEACANILEFTK